MGPLVAAALTAVMVVTPAAMYLGLWRLLAWMRDDDLIDRIERRMEHTEPGRRGPAGATAVVGRPPLAASDLDPDLDGRVARRWTRRGRARRCADCRTPNPPREEACHACGTELGRSASTGVLDRLGR